MFKQGLLAMALALPLAATAAYPEKPVKIIVMQFVHSTRH